MHPAERTQADGQQDAYSDDSGLDCSLEVDGHDNKDMARQEFKDETNVNTILARFGIQSHNLPPQFRELDFSLDLQQALGAIAAAKAAYAILPQELRNTYPSVSQFLAAMESGQITIKQGDRPDETPPTDPPGQ